MCSYVAFVPEKRIPLKHPHRLISLCLYMYVCFVHDIVASHGILITIKILLCHTIGIVAIPLNGRYTY